MLWINTVVSAACVRLRIGEINNDAVRPGFSDNKAAATNEPRESTRCHKSFRDMPSRSAACKKRLLSARRLPSNFSRAGNLLEGSTGSERLSIVASILAYMLDCGDHKNSVAPIQGFLRIGYHDPDAFLRCNVDGCH